MAKLRQKQQGIIDFQKVKLFSLILLFWMLTITNGHASPLAHRLDQFPHWTNKPNLPVATEDLTYPGWMQGTWNVTSILTQQIAPLTPELITPGFESNRRYLHQPLQFQVRFLPTQPIPRPQFPFSLRPSDDLPITADRAFNGQQIAKAYLGQDTPITVKVDPENPNRQITTLPNQRKLVATITQRDSETPSPQQFLTSEITQQFFLGDSTYLNEVETTTAYQLSKPNQIQATQITAIYLSPQDPDYFRAKGHPVALYAYQLNLNRQTAP